MSNIAERIMDMKSAIFNSPKLGGSSLDKIIDVQKITLLITESNERELTIDEAGELNAAYQLLLPIFRSIAD